MYFTFFYEKLFVVIREKNATVNNNYEKITNISQNNRLHFLRKTKITQKILDT